MYDKIAQYQDLSLKEYEALSDEIAEFLAAKTSFDVDTIMRNISVLEVTMAIHKVFDLTQDTLIFDDVDQALVHQILNGDAESLRLRVQNAKVTSSCQFSYGGGLPGDGLALAMAKSIQSEHQTIVILNDNALNHGTTYEALLEIGRMKSNLTLILIDEQKSLLRHYNSMNAALKTVRISRVYNETKKDVKTILGSNSISKSLLDTLTQFKDAIKDAVIEPTIFTQFGFDYHGPINGQKLKDLIRIFELSKTMTGPNVIHIQTRVKEKEYRKLEFPSFKTDHDRPDNYSDYIETLDQVLSLHDDLVMVNDIKYPQDHFKTFQNQYPQQYHTTNGSVDLIIPMVAGLSAKGMKPVVSISSHLATELLGRLSHQMNLLDSLVLIVRDVGLSTQQNALDHGIYDFPVTQNLQNFEVKMAKDMNEASYLLEYALNQRSFTLIRIPAGNEKIEQEVLQFEDVWDVITPINPDSKGVIITFGPHVKKLQRKIEINNLNIGLVNARTINSVDVEILEDIHEKGIPVLIYNCEGRFDLLAQSIYKYLIEHKLHLDIYAKNLEQVDLSLSARQIKERYQLTIDDCINYFRQ